MKILFTIMSMASGGAEMLVRNLAAALAGQGHRCHIVAMTAASTLGNCPIFEEDFKTWLNNYGVSWQILSPASRRNLPASALRFREAVRTFAPDLIHSHTPQALLLQSLARVRTPAVYTHHSTKLKFPPALFRLFDGFVHAYVAISKPCARIFEGRVTKPVVHIPNGVPKQFASLLPRARSRQDALVLSVGNLREPKNYAGLVDAAALVVPRMHVAGRTARFAVAGEGSDRPMVEQRIAHHRLGGSMLLLGARTDIPELLAEADLFASSSLHEAFPIALIEAARSALPIVATDVGGTSEIVSHGESGLLVPSEDPEALAGAILQLLDDPVLYARLSEAAWRNSERFSLDKCAAAHLALYEKCRADPVLGKSL